MAVGLPRKGCELCWILLFWELVVSRLFTVCVNKDFAHHFVLASRGVPFSRSHFGSFAYLDFHPHFKRVFSRNFSGWTLRFIWTFNEILALHLMNLVLVVLRQRRANARNVGLRIFYGG